MKAQTKALVASVVVIALALSAVSGITYSWFTDTEESNISVTTAKVDYDVTYTANAEKGLATASGESSTFAVSNLAASANITIDANITNKSSIKTVYKVVLSTTYTPPDDGSAGFTLYDFGNIQIYQYDKAEKTTLLTQKNEDNSFKDIIIKDWTVVESGANPEKVQVVISTPDSYGSDSSTSDLPAAIRSYDTSTGAGSTSEAATAGTGYAAWSSSDARSGLSFTVKVIAVQGDYPYTTMSTEEISSENVSAAVIPSNKIVTAKELEKSSSVSDGTATNVTIDFSSVNTATGTVEESSGTEVDVTGTKVTAKVTGVDTANSTVTVDLNLYKVSSGSSNEKIENPVFDQPVVITMTVPGALSNPKVVYKAAGEDGTVLSSTVNGSGGTATTTIVFSVMHFSEYVIQDEGIIETLDELKTAMTTGGSYKLVNDLSDVSEDVTVSADSGLDLNGHTITFTGTAGFVYEKTFKVIGTTAGSKIEGKGDGSIWNTEENRAASLTVIGGEYVTGDAFLMYSAGTVTIKGGSFTGNWILIASTGDITIDGGDFKTQGKKIGNSEGLMNISSGNVTINGGTFTAEKNDVIYAAAGVNITVNGGSLKNESDDDSVIFIYSGSVTINGGTFEGGAYPISIQTVGSNTGTLKIYDGTFKMTAGNGTSKTLIDIGADSKAEVGLYGGTFEITATGSGSAYFFYKGTNADITVSGGTYTVNQNEGSTVVCSVASIAGGGSAKIITGGTFNINPSEYLADGYKATENPTGTWTVSADSS